jgi:adenosylcobinamide-GDP ribazoletransferase
VALIGLGPGGGLLALVWTALILAGFAALARRQVGGYTGDVLGATGIIAETAGLLVAAAW